MVVFFHSQCLLKTYESRLGLSQSFLNATPKLSLVGASGVDLFFVISGFIMAYITYNHRGKYAIWYFIKRRIIRIVPLYWFFTLIMAGLLFFFPHLFSAARFDGYGTLLSLLFIPYTSTVSPNSPVLAVGWTLSYEMYFYILVACGLVISYRLFSLLLGLFFIGSVSFGYLYPVQNPVLNLITNPLLFEFYFGLLLGYAYHIFKNTYVKYVAIFCLISGIAGYVLWVMEATKLPLGLFASLLVTGCVFSENIYNTKCPRYLSRIGDSSYSLYLSHYLLIPVLGKICTALGFWHYFPPSAFVILSLPICVSVGYFFYLFIETPLIKTFSS